MSGHNTHNTLPVESRSQVIALFNALLSDTIDLFTQAKQAHWNVKGPNFRPLHELFDEIAHEAQEHADLLAERVVQLGGTALGTARVVAKASSLHEYPLDASASTDHVRAMTDRLAKLCASVRRAIDQCAEARDQGSSDICTQISRALDKQLWFVESHLAK